MGWFNHQLDKQMVVGYWVRRFGCFLKWWYPQIIHVNRFSTVHHPFWGTTILGNTHLCVPVISSKLRWAWTVGFADEKDRKELIIYQPKGSFNDVLHGCITHDFLMFVNKPPPYALKAVFDPAWPQFSKSYIEAIPLVLATRSMTPSAGSALLLETVRKVIDSIEKSWPLQVTLHGSLASCQDVSHHHLLVDGCTQFKRDFLFSVQRSLIIMFRESFFHRFKSARTNTFNTAEKNNKCEGPKSNYFQYHEG